MVIVSDALTDLPEIMKAIPKDAAVIMVDPLKDDLHTVVDELTALTRKTGHKIDSLAVLDHGRTGLS